MCTGSDVPAVAGRSGQAILFVAPRERGMLRAIEKATRQPIEAMGLPTVDDVNAKRVDRFKAAVAHALESENLDVYREGGGSLSGGYRGRDD